MRVCFVIRFRLSARPSLFVRLLVRPPPVLAFLSGRRRTRDSTNKQGKQSRFCEAQEVRHRSILVIQSFQNPARAGRVGFVDCRSPFRTKKPVLRSTTCTPLYLSPPPEEGSRHSISQGELFSTSDPHTRAT